MFVGNLDYVFETIGGQMPYDVWLKTRPGADPQSVVAQLREIDREDWKHRDVQTLIVEEQIRPQRQGLFGMLSIGFVAASLMTLLGFFLYALFSYRRRYVELGVLRAIGLDARQMAGVLAAELACLLAVGLAAGSLIGVWASNTYIPFLQPAAGSESRAVPFLLVIDWPRVYLIYLLYAGLLAAAVAALAVFLRRLRVFQAIKLGETV